MGDLVRSRTRRRNKSGRALLMAVQAMGVGGFVGLLVVGTNHPQPNYWPVVALVWLGSLGIVNTYLAFRSEREERMARYFFSCEGAQTFNDGEGTELPDLYAARIQAIENAGEILRDHPESFSDCPCWRMTVRDETGKVAFHLNFTLEQAVEQIR